MPTILVVERDPSLGSIIQEALKGTYQVFIKADAASAFTFLFQGNIPDLIILDFNRDQIELQELLFELQQNRFFHKIPLILLGNDFASSHHQEGMSTSYFPQMIPKPFSPEKILHFAEKILKPGEHQA